MSDLNGKSIIVTGAGAGLGRAVALSLAKEGSKVTIGEINEKTGAATLAAIEETGGQAQFVKTDISDENSVTRMVETAISAYGQLDGACNNAAVPQSNKSLHEVTLEDWDRVHSVNSRGTFLCIKYEIAAMLGKGGAIVNVSSTGAVRGFPGLTEYSASKAAILGLTRSAAVEYASQGIRVNAVMPGFILTEGGKAALAENPELEAITTSLHPIGRGAEPEEIAAAIVWLLSDEASFVTGACNAVDGGITC